MELVRNRRRRDKLCEELKRMNYRAQLVANVRSVLQEAGEDRRVRMSGDGCA